MKKLTTTLLATSVLALTGCASLQSHDSRVSSVQVAAESGGIAPALQQLESSAKTDAARKELLFNLERGELLRLAKRYPDSTAAFTVADEQVKLWEETAKTSPEKLFRVLDAASISERLKTYEGQDYEKVMLTTRLALNRMAVGDWDNARVDIKRTHEREAVIAEFRSKELWAAEVEARDKGVKSIGRELNGYPAETLEDPAVLALKNGYQNALSHYLSGFLYEALNEPGLAAPGYRKAIELNSSAPLLEEGLRGLDQRISFTHRRGKKMTDVLFLIESGSAPARKPVTFTVPIAIGQGLQGLSVSYPVIKPSNSPYINEVSFGATQIKTQAVVDFNVMARRALKDEMRGMLFRGATRAAAKVAAQEEAQKKWSVFGGLAALVGTTATEKPDDRFWHTLPERVYVARAYLPPGTHKIATDGRDLPEPVVIDGQYAVVPVRVYANSFVVGDVSSFGQLAATEVVDDPAPVKPPKAGRATSSTNKTKSGTRPAKTGTKGGVPVKKPMP